MDLKGIPLAHPRRVKLGTLGPLPDTRFAVKVLRDAGVIQPVRPDMLASVGHATRALGHTRRPPAIAGAASPARRDLSSRTAGVAHLRRGRPPRERARPGAAPRGRQAGDGVAIMARNHRGFVEATLAAAKLGASTST